MRHLEKDMSASDHYHDRITRATRRLAQLQARVLIASHRPEAKAQEKGKREQAIRRRRVATLVSLTGADVFRDAELLGALLIHVDVRADPHRPT